MTGGMICPPVDAAASIAPAVAGLKPRRMIIGMVKAPVPTTLATTLPDMLPNRAEETMAACPTPPRVRPVRAKAILISALLAPVPSSITPKTTKISTTWMTMLSGVP